MAPHLEWRPHSNCRINSLDDFIWRTIRAKKISLALRLECMVPLLYWSDETRGHALFCLRKGAGNWLQLFSEFLLLQCRAEVASYRLRDILVIFQVVCNKFTADKLAWKQNWNSRERYFRSTLQNPRAAVNQSKSCFPT